MSLRIRRGTNAERLQTTLDLGEIAYTTDTKKLYMGDGVTVGGNNILSTSAGVGLAWDNETQTLNISSAILSTSDIVEGANLYHTPERAQDAASTLFTHAGHTGISFTYDDEEDKIYAIANVGLSEAEVAELFTDGTHSGVTFSYNNLTHTINATVNVSQNIEDTVGSMFVNGTHEGISFFYDNPNNVIDATVDIFPTDDPGFLLNNGAGTLSWSESILEQDPSPVLGGDLSLNFNNITGNGDISISGSIGCTSTLNVGTLLDPELSVSYAAGTVSLLTKTNVFLRTNAPRFYMGNNTVSARLYLFSYNDPGANALILRSYNSTADGNNITLFRSRGDGNTPIAVVNNDEMHSIVYSAYDGTNVSTKSIEITATIDGTVSAGVVPGKLQISTANSAGSLLPALTIDSNQLLTASNGLIVSSKYIKFPIYADSTARDAALSSPEAGMVVFLTDRGSSNPGLQVNTDSTVGGWADI
jgi:hypothetical protein